jgi:hypothetical protein
MSPMLNSPQQLKIQILQAMVRMDEDMLVRTWEELQYHLIIRCDTKGVHIEHLYTHVKWLEDILHYIFCLSISYLKYNLSCEFLNLLQKSVFTFHLHIIHFLRMSAKLRKVTISFIMFVCLSICLHGPIWVPPNRFSWNLISEDFLKICWENSLIQIWQE